MKLITVLLIAMSIQVSAKGYSQKVTLKENNITLQKVFEKIKEQTGYQFFYADEVLITAKSVTLNISNGSIQEVLDACFKDQQLSYTISENTIIVRKSIIPEFIIVPPPISTTIVVNGKITDDKGQPLEGATVLIKGTPNGAKSDADGNFSINAAPNATLVISYIGFETREVKVGNRTVINVQLKPSTLAGQDIVVVGYGTQKEASVTGSIATVKGDDLVQSSSANVSNSLAGRIPGVIANNRSGRPGDDNSTIEIRGINSFGGGTSPLIVVDGIPDRDMNRINPDDIESVTVLKDASAAIYGVRSANGVILITTKRGKSGKPTIHYDGSVGIQQYTRLIKRVNAWEYETYANEFAINQGSAATFSQSEIDKFKAGNDPEYISTDWTNATLKKNALQSNHSLSVNGGNEQVRYYFSAQYLDQNPNLKNSDGYFKAFNLRSNVDITVSKNIKVNFDISARKEDRMNGVFDSLFFYNIYGMAPTYPVYWPNGSLDNCYQEGENPYIENSSLPGYNHITNLILNPKLGFDVQLPYVVKGLSLSGYAAFDYNIQSTKKLTQPYVAYTHDRVSGTYSEVTGTNSPPGIITVSQDEQLFNTNTVFMKLAFDRQFGKHGINAFVGYEQSTYNDRETYAYRQNLLSAQLPELFTGDASTQIATGYEAQDGRESYLGKVSYNYDNKYLADFSVRYNGSFNFPATTRWGLFPALSLGWRISDEKFFKNNIKFIEKFKLRASWGLMGSDAVAQYLFLARYTFTTDPVNNVYFGDYNLAPTLLSGSANPNITWEKQDSKNIGFDATLLSNRLNVSFDAFRFLRRDILAQPSASVPLYTGLSLPDENIGKSLNRGIDMSVNYNERRSKLKYDIGANFTYARSKIIFRDEAAGIPAWQKSTGYAIDSWLVYKTNGIYHTQAEVANSPHLPGAGPGDLWIKDIDGDGQITSNDMVRIPESATPHIVYGITMGVEYKGIALNLLWSGQAIAEQSIISQVGGGASGSVIAPQWLYDGRWTAANPIKSIYPRFYNNFLPSDFWLKNAAFIRLKTAELSYTFPANIFAKYGFSKVRVYIDGFNLFSFDHLKKYGIDPEANDFIDISTPRTGGNNNYTYPVTRIYRFGVNIDI